MEKKGLKAGWRIQVFRRNLPSATPFEEGRENDCLPEGIRSKT